MTAKVIDGKALAQKYRHRLKNEVVQLKQKGITPCLTVLMVGNDPASQSYVNGKKRACHETGMISEVIALPEQTTEAELLEHVEHLNNKPSVHGILVQLPLPEHIREYKVIESIHPNKDVDGFHPINIGRMMVGQETFFPCTPHGIITMLKAEDISLEGKHVVIVGRSNIVGKPVGQMLLNEHATVTYCHSKTKDLQKFTSSGDILIVAVGQPHFIRSCDVKPGAVVVDVGINRLNDGTLTGDVDFAEVKQKASYITPVPKGVGPMTITMLLENTIKAAKGRQTIA
ncbi:MAG TPA: bifunctional methylenetetrahydrofolate dehydrogenase/methenyltetrahydrofolate cyclohydrolase FolD [Bacillota bacterium]|nr:bifunctional methylenetetrahydrofolate dehydrogenase/methenyltetrahydrofolate cyclohydrolase FolD [Bacillota bacterium]